MRRSSASTKSRASKGRTIQRPGVSTSATNQTSNKSNSRQVHRSMLKKRRKGLMRRLSTSASAPKKNHTHDKSNSHKAKTPQVLKKQRKGFLLKTHRKGMLLKKHRKGLTRQPSASTKSRAPKGRTIQRPAASTSKKTQTVNKNNSHKTNRSMLKKSRKRVRR